MIKMNVAFEKNISVPCCNKFNIVTKPRPTCTSCRCTEKEVDSFYGGKNDEHEHSRLGGCSKLSALLFEVFIFNYHIMTLVNKTDKEPFTEDKKL